MEDVLTRLIEKVEKRYYGKYRAFVVNNKDPEKRGRLRLQIPSVLGKDVVSGWALPCAPYGGTDDHGFFFVPDEKAGVWAEFEAGDLDYPIWVGTFPAKPGGESEIPKEAKAKAPEEVATQRIIKSASGILIHMDDAAEALTIKDKTGNTIKMSPKEFTIIAKKILTIDAGGEDIVIKGKNITIDAAETNTIKGGSLVDINP